MDRGLAHSEGVRMNKRMSGIASIAAVLAAVGAPVAAQSNNQSVKGGSGGGSESQPAAATSQAATTASSGTTPSSQPIASTTAAPATLTPIRIVVTGITGRVRHQLTDDSPKVIAKVGDVLREGVKVSIGPKSAIQIRVGDSQDLTFDQLGSFVITDAVNDGVTDITRIDLAQGRVSFDVKKVRFANDVVIRTPDMTLAIKGTVGAIQHTPGRPTVALGDTTNRGRIELNHTLTGRKVVMTHNERSDTAVPDPAINRALAAIVDAPTDAAREKDEVRLIKRTEGSNQTIQLDLDGINAGGSRINLIPMPPTSPGPTSPGVGVPRPQSSLHLDSTNGYLFETIAPLDTALLRTDLAVDTLATDGGSAIVVDPTTGFRVFVYAESKRSGDGVKNTFSSIGLESSVTASEQLGTISGTNLPLIHGLAGVGDTLYASGRLDGADALYRVDLSRLTLDEVMSPGLALEGGLAGLTERGTVVGFGIDPGAPQNAALLERGAIMEMDPRTNYLVTAYPGVHDSLGSAVSASNPAGVDLHAITAITGLAADASSVTMSAIVNSGTGQTALLRYDTTGAGPVLSDVRLAPDRFTTGLASEMAALPVPPRELRDPTGPIDMVALNERFAMMAYSQQALSSGMVERVLRAKILDHASNPQLCAASGALNALPTILARHVDERAGIGQSVAEFRSDLGDLHPCKPGMHDH